ncbi:restriction endonuclease subunit S [Mixta calida]|uniref:restriction endonuclease subunit S n=1 Tax=Mixta calida TaxID=665913 RepID=UPI0029126BC9|nr:restriction endonuclease subunit S [Mixta calida]MDU4288632.1 restriction endonuclease subunit S [Mixta calida]
MAKYKAYPEYKESGVEWLGEIPLNWQIHSLKRAVDGCTNGVWGGEPDDKHDLIVLRVADFNRQSFKISDLKLTTRSILPKDRGSRLLKQGDLLIEKSGGGDKTLVGCVVLFDKKYEAVTSNFVAKMTPRDSYDGHFLTYAFSQLYAGKVNYPSIKQTTGIQNLDADAYLMEKFCFPPKHVQRNISCFLDHETAKIDNLIEKQQQLIELLKEKRQAVISHAVTKGLNPDVPMKDSGVEWLGEVPEHWIVTRLKYLTSTFEQGWSPQCEARLAEEYEYGVLKVGCVNSGEFNPLEHKALPSTLTPQKQYLVKKDDLLISRANTKELVGSSAVIEKDYDNLILCDKLYRLKFRSPINPYFISEFIRTSMVRKQIELSASGASHSMQNIGQDTIKELFIALPPENEVLQLVAFIKNETDVFNSLIGLSNRQVDLLQERRTALISAAVTGKIDVRDWVAPDTQDVEEPQEATA